MVAEQSLCFHVLLVWYLVLVPLLNSSIDCVVWFLYFTSKQRLQLFNILNLHDKTCFPRLLVAHKVQEDCTSLTFAHTDQLCYHSFVSIFFMKFWLQSTYYEDHVRLYVSFHIIICNNTCSRFENA